MSGSKSRPDRPDDTGNKYVAEYLKEVPRSGIRDFFDLVATRDDVISLSIGEPDFTTPWHIREAAIYALDHGATSYTSNLGLSGLRAAVSEYIADMMDVRFDPEREILITVGVSEALDLAVRALLAPGDEVLYHEPCYVSYAPVVKFAHGVPVPVPTRRSDGFRLSRDDLRKKLTPRTKALLLNFPTNPTSAMLSREDALDLAEFAMENDLVVISDEIYSELTYERPHVSMASLPGMKNRTILLHGCSKAWSMTGFRVGFTCGPAALTEAMMKIHQYTMLCAPILSQEAAVEALTNGKESMHAMLDEYRARRNFMHQALTEMGLPCLLPEGTFYAFPYVGDLGMTSRDFALRLLEEERVACVPGTAFGSSGEGYVRCAFAAGLEEIKQGMERMADFVARARSTV